MENVLNHTFYFCYIKEKGQYLGKFTTQQITLKVKSLTIKWSKKAREWENTTIDKLIFSVFSK